MSPDQDPIVAVYGKPIITILHSSSLNHNLGEHWVSPTLY